MKVIEMSFGMFGLYKLFIQRKLGGLWWPCGQYWNNSLLKVVYLEKTHFSSFRHISYKQDDY